MSKFKKYMQLNHDNYNLKGSLKINVFLNAFKILGGKLPQLIV